ncbi:ferredoxin--NADP reductase [Mucilaginibacter pallidiroseus]|uniref:Ferredoxin--NADP reductase n=1 Tax=Mucilaginibacter pallidiroseus TaxID=2599295 RepID=A0A563UIS5_9SPHI|nr:ferredoxin--NADP reductase [Mucilaginibacter pallidiroseus]TWR31168.1 ferredoxin--NADP reductase [Mucilaginibacter pallidiroseus]
MQYYTLKVIDIRAETTDTVTVVLKQPGLKKIKYKAGQYLTLIFRINGRRYLRPYSFSSAPGVDQNLEVTIKRVPGGVVSNHIIDAVKVDDIIEAMEPLGDFVLNEQNKDAHIVLWGAGSGITPLMSIAKYALAQQIARHVTLVYGNRESESVIFKDKITELEFTYQDKFSAFHFFTKAVISGNNPNVIQGRIQPSKVIAVMQEENNFHDTLHYICGPEGLKQSVSTVLHDLGFSDEHIFYEDFEVVRNPVDFAGIVTQQVTIRKDGVDHTVEVTAGKSVLEAGLNALLEMAYSCQTGNCLVCKGKLLKGDLKMIGVKNVPEGLQSDERLLCSSFPVTDDVIVEIE